MMRSDRAILFDLFGTLVRFDGRRLPVLERPEGQVRSTVPAYASLLHQVAPGVSPAAFHEALVHVSVEIAGEQRETRREVPSQQRFARALRAIGAGGDDLERKASCLSAAHMEQLAAAVYVPDGHLAILARIGARWATGLVSNFDHAPTAHRILEQTGLRPLLGNVVISDEFGWRKPATAIFHAALAPLGVAPGESSFIGDSYDDDVVGALAAGLRPIWLRSDERTGPEEAGVCTIRDLGDVQRVLDV